MDKPLIKCGLCGTEFPKTNSRSKYCSQSCKAKAKRRCAPMYDKVCENCHCQFRTKISKSRFCGGKCGAMWARVPTATKECKRCSKTMLAKDAVRNSYCSTECYKAHHHRWCAYCGMQFNGKRKYCSSACKYHEGGTNRERLMAQSRWRADLKQDLLIQLLVERDGDACHICGKTVTVEARGPDRGSVDHVVPLSKGGSNTPDNVKLAHRRCNTSKGNRVRTDFVVFLPEANAPSQHYYS